MLSSRAAALQRPAGLRPAQARPLRRPVRCFKDADTADTPPGKATVRFTIPQQTRFGEHVAVVGSFTNWNTQTPVQLHWGEGSVWTGETELPVGQRLEYKYVVVSERSGQVTWQPGGNLVLELGTSGGQTVLVLDDWLGRTHEVRPASTPPAEAAPVAGAEGEMQPEARAAAPEPASMLEVAVQLEQPAVEEQVAGQQEQPLAPAAEKPTVVAAVAAEVEAANGMPAAEAPAEAEPAAEPVPQEYTAAAELAAAELTADAAEEEAATAAPAALEPVHPTAADSWGAVLAAANQPYVAPQAVEAPAPSSNNGDTSAAAEESEFASAHGGPASQDGEPAVPVAAEPVAAPEAAGAAEESPAAASWRSVLAVANQPFVALQPTAVAEAAKTTNGAAAEGDSAPAATATAAAPEAAVEGAELPATQPSNNGSKPAAAQAEPEAAPAAAPKQAPAQLAPAANSPSSGKPKGLAPWLRLLLAAAVVLAAIILFMKSPWAAVRWALSAV